MSKYFMLNKPRGYVSACSDENKKTVLELFSKEDGEGIFHIGRLDRDTEGLLLFTDDGRLCYDLLQPENEKEKTYLAYVLGEVDEGRLSELCRGVNIYKNSNKITAPAKIEVLDTASLSDIKDCLSDKDAVFARNRPSFSVSLVKITITEGKKHQVKRMMRYIGNRVLYLKRIAFASLSLDENLPLGAYRPLTDNEILLLKNS
jgi:16S rRNA pseudouridine516 synthase